MAHEGVGRTVYMFGFVKGYARKAMNIQDITHHPLRHVIEYRVKIIMFFDDYGVAATKQAFGVGRSTVYDWKKCLREAGGKLEALAPQSRRRKTPTQPTKDFTWHRARILEIRRAHPGIGKEKLYALLQTDIARYEYAHISVSSIGRILNQLKRRGQLPARQRLSMHGRTGTMFSTKSKPRLTKERRGIYRPQKPGDLLQVDCVIKLVAGLRRYVVSAIDYQSEFAFSYTYATLSSASTTDFLVKLRQVAPFEIRRVQTDNGSEFYKYFHDACTKLSITHFWNYPKSPQMNGKIERYNRTIQEDFIDWHLDELALDTTDFNQLLMDWLIWYNSERPHHTLKQISPMKYLLQLQALTTTRESEMWWTHTQAIMNRSNTV